MCFILASRDDSDTRDDAPNKSIWWDFKARANWPPNAGRAHFFFVFHLWFVDASLDTLNIKAEYESQDLFGPYENPRR